MDGREVLSLHDGPIISNISLINKAFSELGEILHYDLIVDYLRINWAYGSGLSEEEAKKILDIALKAGFYYESVDEQHYRRKNVELKSLDPLYEELELTCTPFKLKKRNREYSRVDLNKDSRFTVMDTEEGDAYVLLSRWNLLNDLAVRLFVQKKIMGITYYEASKLIKQHYEIKDPEAFFFPHFDHRFKVTKSGKISLKDYETSQIKPYTREVTDFVKEEVARHVPEIVSFLKGHEGQFIKIRRLIANFFEIEAHKQEFGAYFQALKDQMSNQSSIRISMDEDSLAYLGKEAPEEIETAKLFGKTDHGAIERKIGDLIQNLPSNVEPVPDKGNRVQKNIRGKLDYTLRYYDRIRGTLTAHHFKDWIIDGELHIKLDSENEADIMMMALHDEEKNVLYGAQIEKLMSDCGLVPGQKLHFKWIDGNRVSLTIGEVVEGDFREQERYKDIARLAEEGKLGGKSLLQMITELLIYHPSGLHVSEIARLVRKEAPYAKGSIASVLSSHEFFAKIPGKLGYWKFNPAKWKKSGASILYGERAEVSNKMRKGSKNDLPGGHCPISTEKVVEYLAETAKKNAGRMLNEHFEMMEKDRFLLRALLTYADNIYNKAKKFASDEIPMEDYFQESYFALLSAYENYETSFKGSFYNYFKRYMSSRFDRYEQNNKNLIRIPVHRQYELRNSERDLEARMSREGRVDAELNMDPEYVMLKLNYISLEELSIYETGFENIDDDLHRAKIHSFFSDPFLYDPSMYTRGDGSVESQTPGQEGTMFESMLHEDVYDFTEQEFFEELWKIVDRNFRNIRPSDVLKLRFGFNEENKCHTLEEIGDMFGVTRERVRQIAKKALSKLKRHLAKNRIFMDDYIPGP